MLSDATPEHTDVLEEFGDALGMAFQLSDDIMDITATPARAGQGARPGPRRASTPLPVLHALAHDEHREELASASWRTARPTGRLLDRALEIVRAGGSIDARRGAATADEVGARDRAGRRLPDGPAQTRADPAREVPRGPVRRGGR